MKRIRALLAVGAVAVACGTVPAAAAAPRETALPVAGCATVLDPVGDTSTGPAGVPDQRDVDVTSLTLRTTPTEVVAYVGVVGLLATPPNPYGDLFELRFRVETPDGYADVSAWATRADANSPTAPADAAKSKVVTGYDLVTTANYGAPTVHGTLAGATFDVAHDYVVLRLPRQKVVARNAKPVLTNVYAGGGLSAVPRAESGRSTGDDVLPDWTDTHVSYRLGDDRCFDPRPPARTKPKPGCANIGDPLHDVAPGTTSLADGGADSDVDIQSVVVETVGPAARIRVRTATLPATLPDRTSEQVHVAFGIDTAIFEAVVIRTSAGFGHGILRDNRLVTVGQAIATAYPATHEVVVTFGWDAAMYGEGAEAFTPVTVQRLSVSASRWTDPQETSTQSTAAGWPASYLTLRASDSTAAVAYRVGDNHCVTTGR